MDAKGKFFQLLSARVASGESIKSAASQIGCSISRAYRLAATATFKHRVSELRSEMVCESVGLLATASRAAVERLIELTGNDDPSVALRACTAILDRFSSLSESVDLRSRVEALEAEKNK